MKNKWLHCLIGISILLALTLNGGTGSQAAELSSEDIDAIQKNGQSWLTAWQAHDWKGLSALYTENAIVLPQDDSPKVGREAIAKILAAPPATKNEKLEQLEITGADKLAFVRGMLSFTIAEPGLPAATVTGKYLEIWQKQPDGTWKIIRDIFNFDAPLTAPAVDNPDGQKKQ